MNKFKVLISCLEVPCGGLLCDDACCNTHSYPISVDTNDYESEMKADKRGTCKDSTTKVKQPQSNGLSKRLSQIIADGRRLNDDSSSSEKTLKKALPEIKLYIEGKCKSIAASVRHVKTITLYECQKYLNKSRGPYAAEEPAEENKKVYMEPDGGMFIVNVNGNDIPVLIIEDKVQGTNDLRYEQKKGRQATGNAIERAAKNIRGAEMIFADQDIFPYVIFASGCDFHSSETISKRIEMMNYGTPNHYIGLSSTSSQEEVDEKINKILNSINIKKLFGRSIASVFVKAHKFDEMKHGSSLWKTEEIVVICKKIIDKVFESIL